MSKNQNTIDKELTAEELAKLDAALAQLESLSAGFPALAAEEKTGYVRPPDDAGDWMQGMLTRAEQNLKPTPARL
jgi:ABC-type sugar transport system substrate-binding protein